MIYFLCPHLAHISGGVRMIYHQVDVLNSAGIEAAVVHQREGFRPSWFESGATKVLYPELDIGPSDVVVFSEIEGPQIATMAPGVRKVIFNQNPYYTFRGYKQNLSGSQSPYIHPEVLATITVSQDARTYLSHAFPGARIFRIRHGIDSVLYYPGTTKRKQIAFMPRKHPEDLQQVLSILHFRNALRGFQLVPIHNKTQVEAAAILRESAVFLSFGYPEGFGLPPAEAMACGCVVIGYHGEGGKEYFTPERGFPIEVGDIVGYARTVENVLQKLDANPDACSELTARASAFISAEYSLLHEREDIVKAWNEILSVTR